MNRLNLTLAGLLALQLAVAGGIFLHARPIATEADSWALLELPVEEIDRVEIVDEDGNLARLEKADGAWRLAGYFDLPADDGKLRQVLDTLVADQPAWPVATSASGRARFEVAEDRFRKKLVIGAGDSARTLYLGTSPNYRQVHVRRDGDDAVYGIRLDDYAIAAKPEQWLDRRVLRLDDEITALHGPGYTLQKTDGEWQTRPEGGEPDTAAVDALARALTGLRVDAAERREPAGAVTEIRVDAGESSHEYRFFADGDEYFVRRGDFEPAFRIGKTAFDSIAGVAADQLVDSAGESAS